MTVDAPGTGRPATRLNWLLRQLRDSKGHVCVEATAVRQRGRGAVHSLAELRETPRLAIGDPARELRAFIISLSANAGTKRGNTRGSFVPSLLDIVEEFYADVVQHVKTWTPPPVQVRDDEPLPADVRDVPQQASPTESTVDFAEASRPSSELA